MRLGSSRSGLTPGLQFLAFRPAQIHYSAELMKDTPPFLRILFLVLLSLFPSGAQDAKDPAQLDPSDIYFQGWMALRDSDEYREKEEYEKAFDSATRCKRYMDTVTLYHPDWKPHLIERKQKECAGALESLAPLLPAALDTDAPKLYNAGTTTPPPAARPLTPAEVLQATRIQRDLAEARAKLLEAQDLRNADAARYQRQIGELIAERDKLASSTLNAEIKQLKNRIDLVESEKKALARSLYETRTELTQTKTKLEAQLTESQAKEKAARKVANELNEMLKKERNVSNEVIVGLRQQQEQLADELRETKSLLTVEQRRSERLERLLTDSRGEVESLTTERDHLLKERDQLSELLQLNQGDRIQRLIEQNMTLARNLRESEEAIDSLAKNADLAAEESLRAQRDLAMAKAQIIELRKESDAELERTLTLERRLAEAHTELTARENISDLDEDLREENEMLREVAEKLLVTHKRRREQANLLIAAAKERADQDPSYEQAVNQLLGEEMALTPEQESLIDPIGSDGQFRFDADRATPEERELAGLQLRRYTNAISTAIDKAYNRGKTEVALELCEQLLDQNTGHVPTMINQGVIRLRMGLLDQASESFRNAVAMQGSTQLPYLHYLLGVTQHELNNLDDAEKEYEVAVQLDPSNADAHNSLGIVHAQKGKMGEAREHFELAYRIDNNLLETLENLTRLHQKMNENGAALNYYRQYRKAGGSPRPELETLLAEEINPPAANDEKKPAAKEPASPAAQPVLAEPN